ncbi:MAG TPA: universal stress protein [Anaerolineaceae bacterium]|nr:universal stress protein [Anaerolineaceae bacterium]
MFNRILVPLDGSKLAETVLPLSRYLAEQFQATIILFHVVEKGAPREIHGQHHLREVAEAKEYLDRTAKKFSSTKIEILQDVHEVQEEGVAQTISNHARELQTDLVVLCAHGNGGIRDMLFGSIAQQVIRHVSVPVLFIRPNSAKTSGGIPITQILLPLDGSTAHEAAIPIGAYVAKKCRAKIRLLTIVPTPETLPGKEAITGRFYPNAKSLSLDLSALQADYYLREISAQLTRQGLSVSNTVSRGDVMPKLIESIHSEGNDLVIMATHGQSSFDSHWEGSLTPKLLSKTPVPVMLVRVQANHEIP